MAVSDGKGFGLAMSESSTECSFVSTKVRASFRSCGFLIERTRIAPGETAQVWDAAEEFDRAGVRSRGSSIAREFDRAGVR
jgi:hypothetical protein